MRATFFCVTTAVATFVAAPASAALVSYNFSGTISQVTDTTAPAGNVGGLNVGDTFFGSFQYESADAGADSDADPSRGFYALTGSVTSLLTVTVDGLTFSAGPGAVDVRNDVVSSLSANSDALFYSGGPFDALPPGWSFSPPAGSGVTVAFIDPTGTTFASDALPTSFDVTDWFASQLFLSFTNVTFPGGTDQNVSIVGDVNLIPAAVPEPSSVVLLGLLGAVGGVVGWGKRRRAATAEA